ncbi:GNAT family N-acetyltransferase [Bradyrhizobium ottawaense]|uniref:N-acetyltransferase n=1 Tax=Bradyrhizobium ottawaense TaxID=931866 RepID=A0A2U8P8Q2_9BRAD|nr:GNAT family N-acetyltransferase [Bradyrhizobium ottawaense]AWL94116.1 N-acetyltransferase [Bradyrhizobium ottawaense]
MTDPTDSLVSFQQALLDGELDLQRGALDRDLFVHQDRPQGEVRLTYARLEGKKVTALVIAVMSDPIEGLPCFQLGVAVPESHRRMGLAKSAVEAAIAEMKNGLGRNRIPTFYVEAIVGAHNEPSQHVAAAVISSAPTKVTDEVSGMPALHYARKIG